MPKSHMKSRPAGSTKEATTMLVEACGGLTEAAAQCRLTKSPLGRRADPDQAGDYKPADVIADLEVAAGVPLLLAHLLGRLGWLAASVVANPGEVPEIAHDMAELGQGIGDVFARYAEAMSDREPPGDVDPDEARVLLLALDRMITTGARAMAVLMARTGETARAGRNDV